MKKKNIIILLLIIASLAIWSRNIYLVIVGVSQCDDEFDEQPMIYHWDLPDTLITTLPERTSFVYQAKYRDPFQHWLTPPRPPTPPLTNPIIEVKESPGPTPPPLRFSGILSDSAGILAIIEALNGQTYFAHVSDTVENVIILKIDNNQVECQFEGEKFTLQLRP